MTQVIHIEDGETVSLAGVAASPSAQPRRGDAQILEFQANRRRLCLEEASSLDTFESLGELALRLVAAWKLPRISCRSMAWEEDAPTGYHHEPGEG